MYVATYKFLIGIIFVVREKFYKQTIFVFEVSLARSLLTSIGCVPVNGYICHLQAVMTSYELPAAATEIAVEMVVVLLGLPLATLLVHSL